MPVTVQDRMPMTLGYFRLILRGFGGLDPARRAAILEGTGLDEAELASGRSEISLFQQIRQIENMNALDGEGWVLTQPQVWNPTAHGALGVAVLSAPTLGDGIAVLCRYNRTRAPFLHMRLTQQGARLIAGYEFTAALDEAVWRPILEIALVSVLHLCRAVTGLDCAEMEFRLAGAAPAYAPVLRAALGAHLHFGAKHTAIVMPRSWADLPSVFADAALYRGAIAELEALLQRLDSPGDLRARLERLLHTMPDGRLRASDAAAALGVSPRTLARRLEEEGVPFRTLLDEELKLRASALLKASLTREDIAERLGYRDPTSLSRACRRWFSARDCDKTMR